MKAIALLKPSIVTIEIEREKTFPFKARSFVVQYMCLYKATNTVKLLFPAKLLELFSSSWIHVFYEYITLLRKVSFPLLHLVLIFDPSFSLLSKNKIVYTKIGQL